MLLKSSHQNTYHTHKNQNEIEEDKVVGGNINWSGLPFDPFHPLDKPLPFPQDRRVNQASLFLKL